ncbi:MAG: hypothetical protein U0263_10480 [Polyangiaceae bacterium]
MTDDKARDGNDGGAPDGDTADGTDEAKAADREGDAKGAEAEPEPDAKLPDEKSGAPATESKADAKKPDAAAVNAETGDAEADATPGDAESSKAEAAPSAESSKAEAAPSAESSKAEAAPSAESSKAEAATADTQSGAETAAESKKVDSSEVGESEAADSGGESGSEERPAQSERKSSPSRRPDVEVGSGPPRRAAAWGRPLVRMDAAWTKWEMWLCAVTVLLEVLVLSLWVALKGLSTAADGSSKAGLVFRALTGALALGLVAHFALKKQPEKVRAGATVGASFVGLLLAKTWGQVGVDYASNLLNWYQQASFLTLLGGLRGVGTRLTLLLTLLGGSLATAAGKHITIDLLTRYLRPKQRLPVVIAGWLGASVIVATAAWGFFDHMAIDEFDAKAEASAGEKVSAVTQKLGEHFFIARKQLALDIKTLPHVIKGERYSEWLDAAQWNAWVDQEGFHERYGKQKGELLKISGDMKRAPIVVVPEKGEPRGELVKAANLVFPIGLFVIAFRFLLLCLLALSGHKSVDNEAHGDMNVVPGGKTSEKTDTELTKEDA